MDTARLSPATHATGGFTESSALIHTAPPRVVRDYTPSSCLAFLRDFDAELEKVHPRLHVYVHEGYLVQPTTGRRIIADISHIPAVEQALATPPSPDARPVITPMRAVPSAPLTSEQARYSVFSQARVTVLRTS